MSTQYIRNRIVFEALSTASLSRFLLEAEDRPSFAFDFDQYKSDEQRKIKSAFSATIKTFDELIGFISKLEPTGIKKEKRGLFKNTLAMLKIGRTNLARAMSNLDDITNIERFWAAQQFLFSFSNLLNGLADAVKELQSGDEAAKPESTLKDAMGKDLLLVAKRKFFPTTKQRHAIQSMVDFFAKNEMIDNAVDRAGIPTQRTSPSSKESISETEVEKMEAVASKMLREAEVGEERGVINFLKNLFTAGAKPATVTMAPLFGKQPHQIAEILVSDLNSLRLIDFNNMMSEPGLSNIFLKILSSSKSIEAKTSGLLNKPKDPGVEAMTTVDVDNADDEQKLAFNRGLARMLRKSLYKRGKNSIINSLIDMFDTYNDYDESKIMKRLRSKPALLDRALDNIDKVPKTVRSTITAGMAAVEDPEATRDLAARAAKDPDAAAVEYNSLKQKPPSGVDRVKAGDLIKKINPLVKDDKDGLKTIKFIYRLATDNKEDDEVLKTLELRESLTKRRVLESIQSRSLRLLIEAEGDDVVTRATAAIKKAAKDVGFDEEDTNKIIDVLINKKGVEEQQPEDSKQNLKYQNAKYSSEHIKDSLSKRGYEGDVGKVISAIDKTLEEIELEKDYDDIMTSLAQAFLIENVEAKKIEQFKTILRDNAEDEDSRTLFSNDKFIDELFNHIVDFSKTKKINAEKQGTDTGSKASDEEQETQKTEPGASDQPEEPETPKDDEKEEEKSQPEEKEESFEEPYEGKYKLEYIKKVLSDKDFNLEKFGAKSSNVVKILNNALKIAKDSPVYDDLKKKFNLSEAKKKSNPKVVSIKNYDSLKSIMIDSARELGLSKERQWLESVDSKFFFKLFNHVLGVSTPIPKTTEKQSDKDKSQTTVSDEESKETETDVDQNQQSQSDDEKDAEKDIEVKSGDESSSAQSDEKIKKDGQEDDEKEENAEEKHPLAIVFEQSMEKILKHVAIPAVTNNVKKYAKALNDVLNGKIGEVKSVLGDIYKFKDIKEWFVSFNNVFSTITRIHFEKCVQDTLTIIAKDLHEMRSEERKTAEVKPEYKEKNPEFRESLKEFKIEFLDKLKSMGIESIYDPDGIFKMNNLTMATRKATSYSFPDDNYVAGYEETGYKIKGMNTVGAKIYFTHKILADMWKKANSEVVNESFFDRWMVLAGLAD